MAVASPRLLHCLADTQPAPDADAQHADKHHRLENGFPVAFLLGCLGRALPSLHWYPKGKKGDGGILPPCVGGGGLGSSPRRGGSAPQPHPRLETEGDGSG